MSALRGRRGGWLTGLGWPMLLLSLPLLAFGSLLPARTAAGPTPGHTVTITPSDADLDPATTSYPVLEDGSIDLGTYGAGSIMLDLRNLSGEAGSAAPLHLALGAGLVEVRTAVDAPVRLETGTNAGGIDTELFTSWETREQGRDRLTDRADIRFFDGTSTDAYTVSGEELNSSESWYPLSGNRVEFTSPAAAEGRDAVEVDVEVGTGAVLLRDTTDQVRWTGSTEADTWVVSDWYDEQGGHHDGSETPVPGMTHQAVDSDTADTCIDEAVEDGDDSDPGSWESWRDISELSSRQRRAYEDCLTAAWNDGGGTATATPSAPPASSSPTATPTH